jgi:hypothetical protein
MGSEPEDPIVSLEEIFGKALGLPADQIRVLTLDLDLFSRRLRNTRCTLQQAWDNLIWLSASTNLLYYPDTDDNLEYIIHSNRKSIENFIKNGLWPSEIMTVVPDLEKGIRLYRKLKQLPELTDLHIAVDEMVELLNKLSQMATHMSPIIDDIKAMVKNTSISHNYEFYTIFINWAWNTRFSNTLIIPKYLLVLDDKYTEESRTDMNELNRLYDLFSQAVYVIRNWKHQDQFMAPKVCIVTDMATYNLASDMRLIGFFDIATYMQFITYAFDLAKIKKITLTFDKYALEFTSGKDSGRISRILPFSK